MPSVTDILNAPVAHRGLHDLANGVAENSATAFRLAVEHGYPIECDLQLSADGIPMVFHDDVLDRLTELKGPVSALSAAELGQTPLKSSAAGDRILRLDEMLELVDGRVGFAIELKRQVDGRDADLAAVSAAMLRDYAGPVSVISFSPRILRDLRQHGFKGPRGILVERFKNDYVRKTLSPLQRFCLRHLLHYPLTGFEFIDCHHKSLDLPAVRLFKTLGFPVVTWTITSQADADIALENCDQITFEGYIPKSG